MLSTVNIFTVGRSTTDRPKCPLSVTCTKTSTRTKCGGFIPDGDCILVLKEEISADRKNVSLRGGV